MKFLLRVVVFMLGMFAATPLWAQKVSLALGQATAAPNQVVNLPLTLSEEKIDFLADNDVKAASAVTSACALQADITFDASAAVLEDIALVASRTSSLSLDWQPVSSGLARLVVYSPSCAGMEDGLLANARFRVTANAASGEYPVPMQSFLAGNAQGQTLNARPSPGQIVVNAPVAATQTMIVPATDAWALLLLGVLMLALVTAFSRKTGMFVVVLAVAGVTLPVPQAMAQSAGSTDGIIDVILSRSTASAAEDCNSDGNVDVLDVLCKVCVSSPANRPPVLQDIPGVIKRPGSFDLLLVGSDLSVNLTLQAIDPDGDTLTYALVTGPSTMTVNPTTGALFYPQFSSLHITDSANNVIKVTVSVEDGKGGRDEATFFIGFQGA